MWTRVRGKILLVFFTVNFIYYAFGANEFDRKVQIPSTKWSSIDIDATSGDRDRILNAIEEYKNCDNYMTNPDLQWRLLRAYANYHSEQAERDLFKQKWAAESGYKFAVEIDASQSDKAEALYYYASIVMRYLYFHRIKAIFLGPGLLKSFEKVRRLNPNIDDAGPDRNLGALYFKLPWPLGNNKMALHHFKESVKIAPRRAANRLWLAKALAKEGLYQDGWQHIQFIRAGNFDVSSQHWREIYLRGVEEVAQEYPQYKNPASPERP